MSVDDDRVQELLDHWETLREAGKTLTAEELCRDDSQLTSIVQSHIRRLVAIEPFVRNSLDAKGTPSPLPNSIGPYQVVSEIARGGMGIVYRCRQQNPSREVAVKVIALWRATPLSLRRFLREVKALGMLHHAGIAQIYEAGTTDVGLGAQPFFAMELVDGPALDVYVQQHGLDIRARLELLAKVCEAVQHAHENGVVHRDLKPANILVDPTGQPKVLDFGVARLTDAENEPLTSLHDGCLPIGSLPYMSPEQAAGSSQELDSRCDVYSLGVIAYQLLSGRLPYECRNGTLLERIQVIRDEVPLRLGIINRAFRGDLETLTAKALEKDRHLRYASVAAFAADILRYLQGEPIQARTTSTTYRVYRWCQRRPLVAGLSATLISVLLLGPATMFARERLLRRTAEWNELAARQGFLNLHKYTAEHYLTYRPKSDELEAELLEKSLDFYEQLLARRSSDPKVRHEFSVVLHRTANLSQRRPLEAVKHRRHCLALLDQLVSENPDNRDFRFEHFHNQFLLNFDLSLVGLPNGIAEIEEVLTKARHEMDLLLALDPNNPTYLDAAAALAARTGDLFAKDRSQEARHVWQQAEIIAQRLTESYPDQSHYGKNLLELQMRLATLSASTGDDREADRIMRTILPRSEQLWKRSIGRPFEADLAVDHAVYLTRHAHHLRVMGEYDEARDQFVDAVDLLQDLLDHYPKMYRTQDGLSSALWELGGLAAHRNQVDDARVWLLRCFEVLDQGSDLEVLRRKYATFLRECPLQDLRNPSKADELERIPPTSRLHERRLQR